MADLTTPWTWWDCRHQHHVSAALHTRPLTTLLASVLYTVAARTWSHWTLLHATGFATCRVPYRRWILNQTQEEEHINGIVLNFRVHCIQIKSLRFLWHFINFMHFSLWKSAFWTASLPYLWTMILISFWGLFDSTRACQWRNDTCCMYTQSPAFYALLMGSIFNVDFLENETVRFDENLTVALWYDMQQRVMLPQHPKI